MRPIKFKAQRVSDGEWVEGCYLNLFNEKKREYTHEIAYQLFESASMDYPYPTCDTLFDEIDPNTLCQFTGLHDRNGKDIYEGDIVKYTIDIHYEEIDDISATVVWSVEDARYMLVNDEEYINEEFDNDTCKNSEIIGNIHDKIEER